MKVEQYGRGLVLIPEVHKRTIVFLHGLGDSANGFEDLFYDYPLLPDCKVVLPTAPSSPVTVNNGMVMNSWYDFITIDDEYHHSLENSVEIICKILDEERKHTDCLILGGLSQGAVTSLYTGLAKYTGKIEAIIALSGYAVPMNIPEERKSIPVLIYHGAQDTLLTLERMNLTVGKYLQGVNKTIEINQHLPHSIDMIEWGYVSNWLKNTLNIS
ncbi:hypothetical protein SteCoe_16584 [Stentor coeruleus]|uniref:Phospholipase/carboxylesterase/thioesterase domain-containing protein n=1 Tax=Stentor coeruleus TaxID=5963 RepID=A0A1R2C0Y7_9CILI|nr:hypothetical protein SteCoe_16584 [Stentor coeruleus]